MYYSWLDKFCVKEITECGLTGPFGSVPFSAYHLSPMMTAIKRPNKRRCVFDASYGMSLNKSTPKEFYLHEKTEYDFPSLDDFQEMIVKVGLGARLWKRDLSRFFLQIPIDPLDYPNTGFIWIRPPLHPHTWSTWVSLYTVFPSRRQFPHPNWRNFWIS